MHDLPATDRLDVCLDIFGQQPRLDIHTQVCLCYPLPPDVATSTLISLLTSGLERLTASFPWVAGQVTNEGSCVGNTGVFKIRQLGRTPQLVVRDLVKDALCSTWKSMQEANFPMKLLNESVIAPLPTFHSTEHVGGNSAHSPVFLLQANVLDGGLILTFLGQHQCMDITGQAQLMHLFSKACQDAPFTTEELVIGNLERHSIVPSLNNYTRGSELSRHLEKRPLAQDDGSKGSPCRWASFVFSSASLASLKCSSLKELSQNSSYISTDDVLSAFLWQAIMRARSARIQPTTQTTFARAIDARRFVDIPATYMGIVQNMSYTTYELRELVELPLGQVASALRRALEPQTTTLPFHTQALATYLYNQEDKSQVSPVASLDPTIDVISSSWAKTNCYGLSFGLGLGPPKAVRRPDFTPLESFVYLLPKRQDGEVGVAMCLQQCDMERLKADQQFMKYATYDG